MQNDPEHSTVWPWLSRIALAIAIVVVIVRSTMLEYVREPFDPVPGEPGVGRGPGPTTSLILDLLAVTPALLVALRAAVDRSFQLRRSWGNGVMLVLGICVVVGAYRGDDRFAAVIGAANVVAALSLLWATQQVVRSWRQLRIVAAIAFGLLLVYSAHGFIDKFVELPARQQNLQRNAAGMLQTMGIEPGSYEAERLMRKISTGELLGFAASINTFAAVMVTLGIVAAGVVIQRLRDGAEPGPAALVVLGLIISFVVIAWTDSRTALATPLLAAVLLGGFAALGGVLTRHRRVAFGAAIIGGFAVIALLVVRGVSAGNLFHDSLTFRWRYWVGAYKVWLEQPMLGVGFDNFQFRYLAHRLPIAAEEVKDPHNFLVRAFAELGIVGGLLTIVWVIKGQFDMTAASRQSTETTTPVAGEPRAAAQRAEPLQYMAGGSAGDAKGYGDLGRLASLCVSGMLLGFIVANDWKHVDWNISIDALKRMLYACLLTIGAALVALRSLKDQTIETRPAPWIRTAMTVAVVIFLVHNLVDFSMFESSAMFIAALIAGATWGVGLPERPEWRSITLARLGAGLVVAAAVIILWIGPTMLSESDADAGDEALRARQYATAYQHYRSAWQRVPSNADYAHRAVRALAYSPQRPRPELIHEMLDAAIAANPLNGKYWTARAQFETQQPQPEVDAIRRDYEQILKIDPANVQRRLEYADGLVRLNQPAEAKKQYQIALDYNDKLHPDEPKRLGPKQLAEVRQKLSRLAE